MMSLWRGVGHFTGIDRIKLSGNLGATGIGCKSSGNLGATGWVPLSAGNLGSAERDESSERRQPESARGSIYEVSAALLESTGLGVLRSCTSQSAVRE